MIYDISPPLSKDYPVWPSDTPLTYTRSVDLDKGDPVTISTLQATSHLGSHAVCAFMVERQKPSIGEINPDLFMGLCEVIEVSTEPRELIKKKHLPEHFKAPRVLIKTKSKTDFEIFDPNYPALDPSLFKLFADQGVLLVGTDTPSIDLYTSCTQLLSQKEASRYNIPLLLNLWLDRVSPGVYELVALPLKLMGCEASPVRALLRTVS